MKSSPAIPRFGVITGDLWLNWDWREDAIDREEPESIPIFLGL